MAKKLVSVITPNPPIWISKMIIICLSSVKVDGTLTETSPVTHVALVAVNNASIHEIP